MSQIPFHCAIAVFWTGAVRPVQSILTEMHAAIQNKHDLGVFSDVT